MLCDICHAREATIMYTEIINGMKTEQHLCESCANDKKLAIKDKMGNEISIGSILSGILQNYARGISAKSANEPVCMRCGLTASELVKGGRLGCPECYNAFSMILDKNLKTVQGQVEHHGKEPVNAKKIEVAPPVQNIRTAADVMKEATDEIARMNMRRDKATRAAEPEKNSEGGKETDTVNRESLSTAAEKKIEILNASLAEALAIEDYDEAARLRDEIRAIRGEDSVKLKKPVSKKSRSKKGDGADEQ